MFQQFICNKNENKFQREGCISGGFHRLNKRSVLFARGTFFSIKNHQIAFTELLNLTLNRPLGPWCRPLRRSLGYYYTVVKSRVSRTRTRCKLTHTHTVRWQHDDRPNRKRKTVVPRAARVQYEKLPSRVSSMIRVRRWRFIWPSKMYPTGLVRRIRAR